MRTFSGEKLSAIGEVGRIQIRDTSIPSFYPVFSMEGSVKRMPVRPKIVCSRTENRLAQIVPSFCFCFFTKRMAWFTNNTF